MSWIRHRFTFIVLCGAAVVWAVFYTIALAPLLWVLAARLVVRNWRSGADSRMAAMDPPERFLAVAVAALPEHRREWGRAMTAELAEVEGRSDRWRFALSSVRASLCLPPPVGGWPVLALVAGLGGAATLAVGSVVAGPVPGLRVFAVTFIGVIGALMVLAVVRSRRPRLAAPTASAVLAGGVGAAIVTTVIFLRREPAASQYLPPAAAVYLAAVLAGCLWLAVASPRWLGVNRLAPHLGAAAGVVFAAWFLLIIRTDGIESPLPLVLLLALVLPLTPLAVCFVPSFVAARADGSFRSGVQAAVWTVMALVPLTYAVWLPEGLRRHAIDGKSLIGEGGQAAVGVNITDALIFCLGIFPVLVLPLAAIGAALGARHARQAPTILPG
jgi:hypothetical protein